MRYLSVCSGIEAATVAWHPLGWTPVAFSEIEKFPSAVLAHHYPNVPNYGDMTQHEHWPIGPGSVDLLVGGTPCQSFSVAGLRNGLADPRGNLALTYLAIADRIRPRWIVWENVPGVLSSSGGWDFGSFLGALAELGYGFAYRVLDAQYFGVAQRRRRVFVVGHLGDWRRAAAVLFERESLRGDPAPSRAKGQGTSVDAQAGARAGLHATVGALCADIHPGAYSGQDAYTGRLVPAAFSIREDATVGNFSATPLDIANALQAHQPAPSSHHAQTFVAHAAVATTMAVRRLTPVECDRLQGFPDGYTAIPWRGKPATECPDGPRYRALGNSMAVPCMSWIGKRIAQVDALPQPM